jgi:hypothetical protein
VVSGVDAGANWFGPWNPLKPFVQNPDEAGVVGRRFNYPVGRNLQYTPRGQEVGISFAELRALADNCDVLRGVIEARKDQLSALDWAIRPRESSSEAGGEESTPEAAPDLVDEGGSSYGASKVAKAAGAGTPIAGANATRQASGMTSGVPTGNRQPSIPRKDLHTLRLSKSDKDRIRNLTDFLQYPDKENSWDVWCRALNEDMFVIDGATIYKRRTRGKKLYALEYIDGSTIFPLLDAEGRRPTNPTDPSYQQILHGIPAVNYTSSELMYMPRNRRTDRVYGLGQTEQVVITVNTAIRRQAFQLEYYLSGSTPDAFVGLPAAWNLANVKDFQQYFDSLLVGELATRRKVRFMPGDFKYVETKEPPLKDDYDEWLARVICFIFSISPEPFVTHLNRATAGTAKSRALEEGLLPLQRWWKFLMDQIIRYDLNSPDMEFVFLDDREQDPLIQMQIDTGYVKGGIFSIDEVREDRGKLPVGEQAETLMLATTSGYVPIGALTGPGAVAALAAQGSPGANATHGTPTGDSGGDSGGTHQV